MQDISFRENTQLIIIIFLKLKRELEQQSQRFASMEEKMRNVSIIGYSSAHKLLIFRF